MNAARRLAVVAATIATVITAPPAAASAPAEFPAGGSVQNVPTVSGCYRGADYDVVHDLLWVIRDSGNCGALTVRSYDLGTKLFGSAVSVPNLTDHISVAAGAGSLYTATFDGTITRRAIPSLTVMSEFSMGTPVLDLFASADDPALIVVRTTQGSRAMTATGTPVGSTLTAGLKEVGDDLFVAEDGSSAIVRLGPGGLAQDPTARAGGTLPAHLSLNGNIYYSGGTVQSATTWEVVEANEYDSVYADPYSNDVYFSAFQTGGYYVENTATGVVAGAGGELPIAEPIPAGPGIAVEFSFSGLRTYYLGDYPRVPLPAVKSAVKTNTRSRTITDLDGTDIAYDAARQLVYASTSNLAASNGGAVFKINALTGAVLGRRAVGARPTQLALSDDGSTLYTNDVSTGEVIRLAATTLTEQLRFRPGGLTSRITDLAVLRGQPNAVAVAMNGVVTIYDDDVARPGRAAGDFVSPGRQPGELYVACDLAGVQPCTFNPCDFEPDPAGCILPSQRTPAVSRRTIGPSGFTTSAVRMTIAGARVLLPDRTLWGSGLDSGLTTAEADVVRRAAPGANVLFDPATRRATGLDSTIVETLVPRAVVGRLPADVGTFTGNLQLVGTARMVRQTPTALSFVDIGITEPHHEGEFVPVAPTRILDTRDGTGRSGTRGPIGPATAISVSITSPLHVSAADVNAVVLTVTVTGPTASGYLTVYPTGVTRPKISNLNFTPGETIPNLVTVPVGPDGRIRVFNPFGRSHVVVDVLGYYTDIGGPAGARFRALDRPSRVLDTRNGTGTAGKRTPVGPDQSIRLNLTRAFSFAGADLDQPYIRAVLLNVTVADASTPTFVTVYEDGIERPVASNLNPVPDKVTANQVIADVSADGAIRLYNRAGNVHLVADLVGYYIADYSSPGGRFVPFVPERVFDTRIDPVFPPPGAIPGDAALYLPVQAGNLYGAYVFNTTATGATAPTYIAAVPWTGNLIPPRGISSLNVAPGQTVANHVTVSVVSGVAFWNRFGSVHVIGDVFGGFLKGDTWEQATGQAVGATQGAGSAGSSPATAPSFRVQRG